MDKEDIRYIQTQTYTHTYTHIHNGILFSHGKEGNLVLKQHGWAFFILLGDKGKKLAPEFVEQFWQGFIADYGYGVYYLSNIK